MPPSSRLPLIAAVALAVCGSAAGQTITYDLCMSGDEQNPPIATSGHAHATVVVDTAANTVDVNGTYADLVGTAGNAHIHRGTIGNDGGVLFALSTSGGTSGTFAGSGTLPAGDIALITSGSAYLNLHTSAHSGGEIRGQVDNVVGTNYCTGSPNSAGSGACLTASGCYVISENLFELTASGLPATVPGLFFFGPNPIDAPFGDGRRCVGGTTTRIQPVVFASGGVASRSVDLSTAPVSGNIAPASTSHFQFWYRDPMGPGGNGFNTTDGLAVTWN